MNMSRYMEVANDLARTIDAGNYLERQALPSERTLSEEFDVSRETMRKAIKLLEAQGYVVSRQGRGTFVAPGALRSMQRSIDGFSDEAVRTGHKPGQIIQSVTVMAAPLFVARSLGLALGTQVVRVQRIRLLDGKRIGLHDSYLAVDNPQTLSAEKLDGTSLYRLLETECGLTLTDAAESISAVSASGDEAEALGLAPGTPLLQIERITVADDLRPMEFCVMKYAQSYNYDTVVRRRNLGL
jgi:GntR family transcriptional regulator